MDKILWVVIGLILGLILSRIFKKKNKVLGCLRVDRSDPDECYLFLEIPTENELNEIARSKYVFLQVKAKNLIPPN